MEITIVYVDYIIIYQSSVSDDIFVFKVCLNFACASFTVYFVHSHNDTPPPQIKEISKWISENFFK